MKKNHDAWTDDDGRTAVDRRLAELSDAFERERPKAADFEAALRVGPFPSTRPMSQLDEFYRRKLGFAILNIGGQTIFEALLS
ncbi:MAG: hypothetical protein QOC81_1150 [Thermoanaerobaculia bacterium]|jgi:hypothetical protein|nr:hypothetical protein [Thermoanaerobaculia bacterium]